ncbi:MAG: hypothetical protein FD143_3127 [Ignavibacteria bacterium]|nr:MAG: hypothetical protein FD143_3127 [Ignavibacteria bacterium]
MQKLPVSFKKYFWDCSFDELDYSLHKEFILKRLMNYGDMNAIQYILNEISLSEINSLIEKRGSNIFIGKNYFFWKRITKHAELWTR